MAKRVFERRANTTIERSRLSLRLSLAASEALQKSFENTTEANKNSDTSL